MQIIVHPGAHFTDEDRLIKCLMRNAETLAKTGMVVPGPGKYRKLLKNTFTALKDTAPAPDARDVVLDAILDDSHADRMFLSNVHMFGAPRAGIRNGMIYPMAGPRMAVLDRLFSHDQVEMFIGIRNPASYLPEMFKQSPHQELENFTGGVDPRHICWSEMIERVRREAPGVAITVWCNEDTPLIWGQLVREAAGLDHGTPIVGSYDLLGEIMSKEGMQRFQAYLDQHPGMSEMQVRRIISAFLDKYALEDELEEELDLPGWDEALVDEMTDIYDEDVFEIQRIPGVTFIEP